jgi:hypothetical protein
MVQVTVDAHNVWTVFVINVGDTEAENPPRSLTRSVRDGKRKGKATQLESDLVSYFPTAGVSGMSLVLGEVWPLANT